MSPVVYAPRMKVIHAFYGTFPVTEKVIYTFLYYYVMQGVIFRENSRNIVNDTRYFPWKFFTNDESGYFPWNMVIFRETWK